MRTDHTGKHTRAAERETKIEAVQKQLTTAVESHMTGTGWRARTRCAAEIVRSTVYVRPNEAIGL